MKKDNFIKGQIGEEIAAKYLIDKGYEIIQRNFKIKNAEIDIIAIKSNIIFFIEVKSRINIDFGYACEAVNERKQNKIKMAAEIFLSKTNYNYEEVSFDVIEVYYDKKEINHIENCF